MDVLYIVLIICSCITMPFICCMILTFMYCMLYSICNYDYNEMKSCICDDDEEITRCNCCNFKKYDKKMHRCCTGYCNDKQCC